MSPLDLLLWVAAVAVSLVIAFITAAVIVGCVRSIAGRTSKPVNLSAVGASRAQVGREIVKAIDEHERLGGRRPRSGR